MLLYWQCEYKKGIFSRRYIIGKGADEKINDHISELFSLFGLMRAKPEGI